VDRKWWVLLAVGVGGFMTALDGSVANIVLPVLRTRLKPMWPRRVGSHNLPARRERLLLSFGRLGDMRGHKAVYVSGFLVFVISSALCGLAPTAGLLIALRALQALGGRCSWQLAGYSHQKLSAHAAWQALGMQATMIYLGLTAGPSLGGWLTSQFGWRAVFYINVPVGLLALWLSQRFIPRDETTALAAERFDLAGALAFMAGLVALLLGLNQGEEWAGHRPRF